MEQSREWSFGEHRIAFEPPDMLWATFSGAVSPDEARWLAALCEEASARGRVYLVSDVAHAELPAESRKCLAEQGRAEWFHGIVYLGADLTHRAIGKALSVALLFSSTANFETVFVDTEDEARDWVDAHRARRGQPRLQVG